MLGPALLSRMESSLSFKEGGKGQVSFSKEGNGGSVYESDILQKHFHNGKNLELLQQHNNPNVLFSLPRKFCSHDFIYNSDFLKGHRKSHRMEMGQAGTVAGHWRENHARSPKRPGASGSRAREVTKSPRAAALGSKRSSFAAQLRGKAGT